MKIKNQLLLIITIFGLLSCKKNIQDKDIATKYNVKYNLSGIYINDVLQTVESNNFNIDFYSIMNNDSFKIKSYLYFNKLNNYNLIYIQNNTQDTAFFFKFNENRFSNKGVRFVKKDDSLLLSNIMINDSTYNYYVLKTYNLGKLNFRNNNPINLRVANTSNDDLEKDIDNAIKYFGQTPLITWIKDKSDEIKNKADEIGDWIIESVNDIIKYNTTDPKDINNSNLSQNEINDHNNVKNQIKNKFNETDCMGLTNGAAVIDDCGFCSGGTSGNSANIDKDCNGDCHGTARLDDCGICVEGNTGKA
jgi:hypothetical protein